MYVGVTKLMTFMTSWQLYSRDLLG